MSNAKYNKRVNKDRDRKKSNRDKFEIKRRKNKKNGRREIENENW